MAANLAASIARDSKWESIPADPPDSTSSPRAGQTPQVAQHGFVMSSNRCIVCIIAVCKYIPANVKLLLSSSEKQVDRATGRRVAGSRREKDAARHPNERGRAVRMARPIRPETATRRAAYANKSQL